MFVTPLHKVSFSLLAFLPMPEQGGQTPPLQYHPFMSS